MSIRDPHSLIRRMYDLPSANSILLHIRLYKSKMENHVAEPLAMATLLRTYLDEISFIDDQKAQINDQKTQNEELRNEISDATAAI
jgi:hypothetical protein